MTEELKIGDIVRLNSGSPTMTIVAINEAELMGMKNIKCSWFIKGESKSDTFPSNCLEKYNPDKEDYENL